jgi:iron complex outermembrane receptor protein
MKTQNHPKLTAITKALIIAGCLSHPLIGYSQTTSSDKDTTTLFVDASKVDKSEPSSLKLESRMPQSSINQEFIENYLSPTASFVESAGIAPSVTGFNSNGPGLNDEKLTLRGFTSSQITVNFDGIPFNDMNGVSYHSTLYAPSQFLGGVVVDRSPGLASTFGPANYGGTINLLSKGVPNELGGSLYTSIGTWQTQVSGFEVATGLIGEEKKTKVLFGGHYMSSDGYQTNYPSDRIGGFLKLESELTNDLKLTLFLSAINYKTPLPDKGTAGYAAQTNPIFSGQPFYVGQNYLASCDARRIDSSCNAYNSQDLKTTMNYIDVAGNLSSDWSFDNKLYNLSYNNMVWSTNGTDSATNVPGSGTGSLNSNSGTSGMNNKNSYQKFGDILRVENHNSLGTFRTGFWYESAFESKFQTYTNISTGAVSSVLHSNNYNIITSQPFAEFEFKVTPDLLVTPGVKYSSYHLSYLASPDTTTNLTSPISTGADYTYTHPFLDLHYMIQPNWSLYGQFATGDAWGDPTKGQFDRNYAGNYTPYNNGNIQPLIQTKTSQFGTVFKAPKWNVNLDYYVTKADNSVSYDAVNQVYNANGSITYSGYEAEGNYKIGHGFSLYGNASKLNALYDVNGASAAYIPSDMETLGLFYNQSNWMIGATAKRIGQMYVDGKSGSPTGIANPVGGNVNQWAQLDPIFQTGLYATYTFRNLGTWAKSASLRIGMDNVFNQISLLTISPASANSNPNAPGTDLSGAHASTSSPNNDVVTWTSGRFTSLTLKVNF